MLTKWRRKEGVGGVWVGETEGRRARKVFAPLFFCSNKGLWGGGGGFRGLLGLLGYLPLGKLIEGRRMAQGGGINSRKKKLSRCGRANVLKMFSICHAHTGMMDIKTLTILCRKHYQQKIT